MSILVTGGCGYIGSHTVLKLLEAGREVVVLDNLCNSKVDSLEKLERFTGKKIPFYKADLLSSEAVEAVFRENEIVSVVHFAGLKAVGESCQLPLTYYENNICGTLRLLRVMEKYGVKKLVFSSSSTVYGSESLPPWKENAPLGATNPYGRTKMFLERILTDLWRSDRNWAIVMLRYFNPIGAHPSGLIGEDPNGVPNNLAPYVCKVAAGLLPGLKVFGGDYPTPDGTAVRDYIHVVDVASGHLSALDWIGSHTGVQVVNLGTGRGYSVLEVIRAVEQSSGRKVNFEIVGRREGDVAVTLSDPQKAREIFGWEARCDLQQMADDMWRFTLKNSGVGHT